MSDSAMAYVMDLHQGADGTPLIPAEKLILILLSDGWFLDDFPELRFSFEDLASDAEMKTPELLTHLLHLEEIGVLATQALPQADGERTHVCKFMGFVAAWSSAVTLKLEARR